MAKLKKYSVKRFGWIPDIPDHRDLVYAAPMLTTALPPRANLTGKMPPVYDQGQLGSCTANAVGAAVQFVRRKQGKKPDFVPSRLFIYYNERDVEGTVEQDSGAQLRTGMKVAAKLGVTTEKSAPAQRYDWPYDIERFAQKPPGACYKFALAHQVLVYRRVPRSLNQMKGCLASGYPFVFGFSVYDSFDSAEVARTGVVPMPQPSEAFLGGHAVVAVGYDDETQRFIVRNSWGRKWGQKGYFTMPYQYLTDSDLSDDFWTVRLNE